MEDISKPVVKRDHVPKMSGSALYVDDIVLENMLCGKLLRSARARARITGVRLPPLPEGYLVVDHTDVPGQNSVHIVKDDTPVFAAEFVEYIGDPILMVVGPDPAVVNRILGEITVDYEELAPILDMMASDTVFFHYSYEKGSFDQALAEADLIHEETFRTGHQEQAYMETQGMIAYPEGNIITVRGSLQCPYYVHNAVAAAMGVRKDEVRIIQDVTGGAFGGKEDYPSILGCQVAAAAKKAGRPVKVVFDRREDIEFTTKRHPSVCTYTAAIKDGQVIGLDIKAIYNSGAYTTLTPVVLQRGIICAGGVYNIPNLRVDGKAVKTNTVPCGAFRGFGGPQTFFAVEMMMDHLAAKLGEEPLAFKEKHLARQGDATSTSGRYHFHIPLPEMIARIDELSSYRAKRSLYRTQTGRYRRGIGLSIVFHGCGFTGSGERDHIKAVMKLHKTADGKVEILVSNTDMGQGLKTTYSKVVADVCGIPLGQVIIENPDTGRVPDSGPTVASRSMMTVGGLLKNAAEKLRASWIDGEDQWVEERYVQPDFLIPFDLECFCGDAYPVYSWSVTAVELEVDTLSAAVKILHAWGVYDVGVPIDTNIVKGQMEGGLLQGLAYAAMEQIGTDNKGRVRNNSFSDYIIPTSMDAPNLTVEIIRNPYPHGPYGAKGAGELPLVGAAPAYLDALECALGRHLNHIPFTSENIMDILKEVGHDDSF